METRGPTLEEVAKIFDGEDAEVAYIDLEKVEAGFMTSGYEKNDNIRIEHIGRPSQA